MIYYVIPAREGSKGFPHKNRKLFDYTAKELFNVNEKNVIVTTNDQFIIKKAEQYRFNVLRRSEELSNDTAAPKDVLLDVVDKFDIKEDDIIVMLYLTYPDRTYNDIQKVIKFFENIESKSVLCKVNPKTHPYLCLLDVGDDKGRQLIKHDFYRRQDYPEMFQIVHYVFCAYAGEIKNLNNNLYNDDTDFFNIVTKINDIDYPDDFMEFEEGK